MRNAHATMSLSKKQSMAEVARAFNSLHLNPTDPDRPKTYSQMHQKLSEPHVIELGMQCINRLYLRCGGPIALSKRQLRAFLSIHMMIEYREHFFDVMEQLELTLIIISMRCISRFYTILMKLEEGLALPENSERFALDVEQFLELFEQWQEMDFAKFCHQAKSQLDELYELQSHYERENKADGTIGSMWQRCEERIVQCRETLVKVAGLETLHEYDERRRGSLSLADGPFFTSK